MTKWACFKNGEFHRTVESDEKPDPNPTKGFEWYPVASPERQEGEPAGWRVVDGEAVNFKAPPAPPQPRRLGSFIEFMALFTPEEQFVLATAAMTNAHIKLWYDQAVGANEIDLDSPNVIGGFQVMVDASLVTSERRDEILAGGFDA